VSAPFNPPIDARTRYCAVFGHPIRHSASPAMQNAGIAALGLNWRYLAFDVDPQHLREALAGAKRMGFIGVNFTLPHKLLAVEMMDALDASAKTWGAVNTVRFEARDVKGRWQPLHSFGVPPSGGPSAGTRSPKGGTPNMTSLEIRMRGFNTDADAISRSLREDLGVELRGAKVLLLGAGGAGRTAAFRLASESVGELFLVNRTQSKAEVVAKEIHERHPKIKMHIGYPRGEADLVLNATSLGLKANDPLPLDEKKFPLKRARAVYDMVYRPAETPLLKAAKNAGCETANGLGMLLYQGASALEIWSGQTAQLDDMRKALETNVYGKS
jgi:shikimate dehydrogenase